MYFLKVFGMPMTVTKILIMCSQAIVVKLKVTVWNR